MSTPIDMNSIAIQLEEMSKEERKQMLERMEEFMCLACGGDAPCSCHPAYDE